MTRSMLCHKKLGAVLRARHSTQTALAEAAGISQPAVRYYLQEPRDPAVPIVLAFAKFLDVRPQALLKAKKEPVPDLSISQAVAISERTGLDLKELHHE